MEQLKLNNMRKNVLMRLLLSQQPQVSGKTRCLFAPLGFFSRDLHCARFPEFSLSGKPSRRLSIVFINNWTEHSIKDSKFVSRHSGRILIGDVEDFLLQERKL